MYRRRDVNGEREADARILREQRRRRAVLWSIALLLLLATSPVFGHHVAGSAESLLAGKDRVGQLCLIALHEVLAPVHRVFHVLVIAGLLYALWDRVRAWRLLSRTLALLDYRAPRPGDSLWTAAAGVGLDPRRLRLVEALPNPAFTAGWIHPRVYVNRAL